MKEGQMGERTLVEKPMLTGERMSGEATIQNEAAKRDVDSRIKPKERAVVSTQRRIAHLPETTRSGVQKGEIPPSTNAASSPSQILLHNRVRPIALHIPWYGFRTQARLARDSGISRAAVSRLVRYEAMPSLAVALRLTRSLSQRLQRPLDVWEVFSLDGTYPTASVCELCGCRSCLPPEAYDREDKIRPPYEAPSQDAWQVSSELLVLEKGGK